MQPENTTRHPGEIIRIVLLQGTRLSQQALADALDVSRRTVNELVTGRRSISADMACRLERVSGVPASIWLSQQADYDIARAKTRLARDPGFAALRKLPFSPGDWHFISGRHRAAVKQSLRERQAAALKSADITPDEAQRHNRFIMPAPRQAVTFADYDDGTFS